MWQRVLHFVFVASNIHQCTSFCSHLQAPILSAFHGSQANASPNQGTSTNMALGEFTILLRKPFGMILEERECENSGLQVGSLSRGGAAELCGGIVRGDALVKVGDKDFSSADFDTVMDFLIALPENKDITLTLSDGLGRMDIARNLAKKLKAEEAITVDQVVRAAVRKIRSEKSVQGQLGDLLRVEIVIGAGVKNDGRCMVRFFAIFSRDAVTTFSCSVSATGIKVADGTIDIIALSCAKDEGWGQTVDIVVDSQSSG